MTMRISQRVTAIGKRVLAQTAMSATVMTGLHFASVAEFPPLRWVLGPADAPQASLADAPGDGTPAGAPGIRVVALPRGSIAAPYGPPAPSVVSTADAPPSSPQQTAMIGPAQAEPCGPACAPVPHAVARPTPRPAPPKTVAERQRSPVDLSTPAAVADGREWREASELPMQTAQSMAEPDDIPMPPPVPATSGFVFADLIPGGQVVMEGVSFVGSQARDVVAGAANGALDLVRR